MRIRDIELKGWRSYDGDGIKLENFKTINIIIGPNNCGKSNIFKYLYRLKKSVLKEIEVKRFGAKKAEQFNGVKFTQDNYNLLKNLPLSFRDEDSWAWGKNNIECKIALDYEDGIWELGLPNYRPEDGIAILSAVHNFRPEERSVLSVLYKGKPLIKVDENKIYNIEKERYEDTGPNIKVAGDTLKYWKKFFDSMIFIDPIRHYDRGSTSFSECDFDGSNIIKDIVDIHINNRQEWMDYESKINEWFSYILLEENIEIDLEDQNGIVRFKISRGHRRILTDLSQLGTGVCQLFMLLSYLFINREKSLNIFMEEPECNLHPEALVKLVEIFEDDFPNNRFFITTHSSVLIDQLDRNWSIHRLIRRTNKATVAYSCETVIQKYEILDELGIRASQLLQSNMLIWIEGASDRVYLNKWIKDLSNGELKEGKHYSYIMYGGSNLVSYDLLSDESCIDILSTSRYSFLICDSDKDKADKDLKGRVKKIKERIEDLNSRIEGDEKELKCYIKLWVTDGREIENYIPKNCFIDVLSHEDIKRKHFIENNKQVEVNIDVGLIKNEDFDKYESFDEFFAKMYQISGSRKSLNEEQKQKISSHYSGKKVDISKRAVDCWKSEYYDDNPDLKQHIIELINHIKIASGKKTP